MLNHQRFEESLHCKNTHLFVRGCLGFLLKIEDRRESLTELERLEVVSVFCSEHLSIHVGLREAVKKLQTIAQAEHESSLFVHSQKNQAGDAVTS